MSEELNIPFGIRSIFVTRNAMPAKNKKNGGGTRVNNRDEQCPRGREDDPARAATLLLTAALHVGWNIHASALLSASTTDFLSKRCYI